jgi:hypothetical protein
MVKMTAMKTTRKRGSEGERRAGTTPKRKGGAKPASRDGKAAGRGEPRWKSVRIASPAAYVAGLPPERRAVVARLRQVLRKNLPAGFEETIDYGMIAWVVPRTLYPAGYHADPSRGLPFIALASQKQYVALYHMGLYAGPLAAWFKAEWPKRTTAKLDLGKSCLRLRNLDDVPYGLVADLARRMTPREWIAIYEAAHPGRRKG